MIVSDEKNSLLIEYLESKGFASYQVDGYRVINRFTKSEEEFDSLYNGVALRNISHQGIIELKGKDSLDLVHRIGTNRINDLPKEGVRKTIFTTEKGRIIGLSTLMNFDNYQLVVCDRSTKLKVMSWIRKYVISDDVEVNDANAKYNLLELRGPQAESFATLVCGNVVSEIQPNSFKIIHTENILFFLIKIPAEKGKNKFWFLALRSISGGAAARRDHRAGSHVRLRPLSASHRPHSEIDCRARPHHASRDRWPALSTHHFHLARRHGNDRRPRRSRPPYRGQLLLH